MKTNCPNKQTLPANGSRPARGGQPSKGRNFGGANAGKKRRPFEKLNCTNVDQVLNPHKVVIGTLNILNYPRKVLFDTGATTSFIAQKLIDAYGSRCCALDHPITILSARGNILVTHKQEKQVIMICNCVYYADLLVIRMKDIAIILGMDWLSNHEAQIDCGEKTISIRNPYGRRVVYEGDKHTRLEVEQQLNSLKEVKLEEILVVKEFQDVFPKELPGMPPDRGIEFIIDLIPGTSPIAQPPYRMSPKELVELKAQLDELEEKGFIRESISPWGTPLIFVDKRDGGRRMCGD
jgi:hypothetical protein